MDDEVGLALNVDLSGIEAGGGGANYSSRARFELKRARKFARGKGDPLPPAPPRPRPPPPPPAANGAAAPAPAAVPPPPPPTTTTAAQRQHQAHRNRAPVVLAATAPLPPPPSRAAHPHRGPNIKAPQPRRQKPAPPRRGYYDDDADGAAGKQQPALIDEGARRELEGLVGLAMAREARLREEEGPGGGGGDDGGGVVEFGDVADDDDNNYFSPAGEGPPNRGGRQHQQQQQQPPCRQRQSQQQQNQQQSQQQQQNQPPLQRRAGGELARAAAPVPLAARGDIFGDASAAASEEGGDTWPALGLCPSLCGHLEALNFAAPTRVQRLAVPALLARRDALVRAATGSGKTLAYLSPIVHDLVERGSFLCAAGGGGGGGDADGDGTAPAPAATARGGRRLSRAEGTYAVVLAPTRELAVQISDVLSAVLRRYPWVVSGLLVGGENRAHEKARLRKGVTALVATPGRLLDHLQNTAAFGVAPLRWLVLDEADRLLDMGFESKVREILGLVERRQREQRPAFLSSSSSQRPPPPLPRRTTALLSATMHSRLRALAELSLSSPVAVGFDPAELLKRLDGGDGGGGGGGGGDGEGEGADCGDGDGGDGAKANGNGKKSAVISSEWEMPATLRQAVVEVPARDRLAALIGALRTRLEDGGGRKAGGRGGGGGGGGCEGEGETAAAAKIVVFLSTCDGVEFHHALMTSPHVARSIATGEGLPSEGGAAGHDGSAADGGYGRALGGKGNKKKKGGGDGGSSDDEDGGGGGDNADDDDQYRDGVLGRGVAVLRLHGDMPQAERTSAFLRFAAAGGGGGGKKSPSAPAQSAERGAVLLCTDVAARGLDFPRVTAIVQYDPPGDPADYVHRVGRTARMGQRGEALLFSLPSEKGYGELLRERSLGKVRLDEAPLEPLLRRCLPAESARALGLGGGGFGGGKGAPRGGSRFVAPPPKISGAAAAGALSRRAVAAVAADPRLKAMASDAFRSFVRAYATHPAALKHVFHVRSLHLGHVAAAFALKEPPQQLGATGSREERKRRKREEELREKQERRRRMHGGGEVVKRRKKEEEEDKGKRAASGGGGGGGRVGLLGARLD